MFPRRYEYVRPEDYPELRLRLWLNPTAAHIRDLFEPAYPDQTERIAALEATLAGDMDEAARVEAEADLEAARLRQTARGRLGLALVASYDGARVEAYETVFDFTNPGAAVDTLIRDTLPEDLRYWLLNAPIQIPQTVVDGLGKTWASSFVPGKN